MEPLSLWLWEIQVLAKLPQKVSLQKIEASNYNEEGIFILLFCKTKEGNTVTVIVDDWKPWCRLLSKDEKKDPLSILGTKNILELRRSVVYSIEKETPKQKLYGWEPNNELGSKTFSSVRLTLNSLYGLDRIESMVQTQTDDAGNLLATNLLLCDTLQRPKTRFLHDTGLCPCAWFTIEGMTANDFKPKDKQVTTSTAEVYAQVKHLKPNFDYFYADLECYVRKNNHLEKEFEFQEQLCPMEK
jgi:hypothetical protein